MNLDNLNSTSVKPFQQTLIYWEYVMVTLYNTLLFYNLNYVVAHHLDRFVSSKTSIVFYNKCLNSWIRITATPY